MMKLSHMLAAGAALAVSSAAPVGAETRVTHHTTTTVTKVHGPLHILPHHNRKVCRTRWVNHHRVKKCSYR